MFTQMPHFNLKIFIFSYFMTNSIIVSFFPLYFDSLGFTKIQIGILFATGPMISILANLSWGIASDRMQTRKRLLIIVLIGQLMTAIILFQTNSFSAILLIIICFFFFQTPTNALTDSLALLTIRGTSKSYASFRVWGSLGFAFTALAFGFVLKWQGVGTVGILALTTIVISILLAFLLQDQRGGSAKPEFSGMLKVISSRKLQWFLLLILTVSIAHRINDGFLALYLRQLGADNSIVGWSWMMSALSEIPVFFYLSRNGHKYNELPLMCVACLVYFIRFMLMGWAVNPIMVFSLQALHSLSFGIFLFTAIRYISQLIPDRYRSTGQALFAVTWSGASGLVSGTLGGWVFQVWGPHVLYRLAALLAFVALCGFIGTYLYEKRMKNNDISTT